MHELWANTSQRCGHDIGTLMMTTMEVKLKFTLEQSLKVQKGKKSITLLFL